VSFTASTPIGVKKDEYVTLVNTERKWCGSAALNTKYDYNNGSYVPAYGFGDYANYDEGIFPTFGALYQSRLCLAGVDSTVLVSGVYDKVVDGAPYRYFQLTDDLSNPTIDPFRIRVPYSQADTVTAIRQWQQFMFVFTRSSVYKTTLDNNGQFSVNTPTLTLTSNVGCVSRDTVETTESTLFFLSENGVFDLGIVATNEYRASEISLPIRNVIKEFGADSKIVYDTFNNKLYVYNERLMVYFTDQKVWSEYKAVLPWDISSFLFWREYVLLCCKTLCDFQITRTEYELYVDFAKTFTSGETVEVQPCAQNIPTYTGVTRYTSPIVMSPVIGERDVTVLYDGVLTDSWDKLNQEDINIEGVEDGKELTFFYKADGSFNGALLFQDNVIQTLNNVSLGVASLNNFCTLVDYNVLDVLDGDGNLYIGGVDPEGNPVYDGTPLLDNSNDDGTLVEGLLVNGEPVYTGGTGDPILLGDSNNPVYIGGSPLPVPRLFRVSPAGEFVEDPTGDPLPKEYPPPSQFECEPIYPDKRCIWTANPLPTAGYGTHGSVVLTGGLELFLHCEISVTPPYSKGCELLRRWKCVGGVCTEDSSGAYTSLSACETARIGQWTLVVNTSPAGLDGCGVNRPASETFTYSGLHTDVWTFSDCNPRGGLNGFCSYKNGVYVRENYVCSPSVASLGSITHTYVCP
jgi:hypothetical protein